jgi:hypothetical protein
VDAANKKVAAEQQAARDKLRQQCHAYLDKGGADAQKNFNSCLDIGAMNSQQRADLAAKNAATCQTLFPNHGSKEFNSCLQNTLDPAFDSDQNMIAKQMHDSGKWWKVGLKIGLGVVIAAGAIACILIEPCGAIVGAVLEAATPLIAPELYGLVAATSTTLLFGGGAAVAEVSIAGSIEADLADVETEEALNVRQAVSDAKAGSTEPAPTSCLNSFRGDTRVLLADGRTERIDRVEVGDTVLARDPVAGLTRTEPVTELHRNQDTALADVALSSGAILHTTQEHPFWDATTRQWTDAADLRSGDMLESKAMAVPPRIAAVRAYTGDRTMYNLTVAELHTFYVMAGRTPVLVHNAGPGCGSLWIDPKSLPHHFMRTSDEGVSHAAQFGVKGNYGKATGQAFVDAIKRFVENPGTKQIRGTFRGQPAIHYVDPDTGLHASFAADGPNVGEYLGGWQSTGDQLKYLLEHGKL